MIIQVTEEHIKRGRVNVKAEPWDCGQNCAVALALIDAGYADPFVEVTELRLSRLDSYSKSIRMPNEMIDWIEDFDHNMPVSPATFEINEVL